MEILISLLFSQLFIPHSFSYNYKEIKTNLYSDDLNKITSSDQQQQQQVCLSLSLYLYNKHYSSSRRNITEIYQKYYHIQIIFN